MRLFVALSIPVDVRENLSSMIDELRCADARPRWVNPLNLHITLKFIGEVSSDGVTEIAAALGKVHAAQHVKLGFGGIGFFPNARRPNVAWIGIESSPNLAPLASDVNLALSPLGPVPCPGPFEKAALDPAFVAAEEARVTRGWRRLQALPTLGLAVPEYPLHLTPSLPGEVS